MRERMQALLDEPMPAGVDTDEFAEARALLAWVADHHFTYLGYREYELTEDALHAVEHSGLGLLRGGGAQSTGFAKLPVAVRALAREPNPLVLAKATTRSPVHRPAYLDYIGVKKFDDEGNVVGERRFLGLYTTGAYNEVPANIPVLRQKAQAVRERAGFVPGSHDDKALIEVIDTFPRDELFQIGVEDLYEIAVGILELGERQRVRLFMRTDRYERFVSCLVFIPRDRFNTANRVKIGEILSEALGAESLDWGLRLTEWVLVRIHYTLHLPADVRPDFDASELEARIVEAVRSWDDDLLEALLEETGEERGMALYRQYGAGFPPAYRDELLARSAVADVQRIEGLTDEDALDLSLYRPLEAPPGALRCKVYRRGERVSLSDVLPMFESLGLTVTDERPYRVTPREGPPVWLYDFGLHARGPVDVDAIRDRFHEGFERVWRGDAEQDGFNGLILAAGLDWREVMMLRAVARYLRQAGIPFSDRYMESTLLAHSGVASALVALFRARFDPAGPRGGAGTVAEQIEQAIDAVDSLDQDRILRGFLSVVTAMLRTNYFLPGPKPYVSFKLDPHQIPLTPLPRPQFEIFVHSPRVEGVHLRGGMVARGGLRWSDRREDFRTEILGLMKAQMVKNAVIVPVGSKGGFVVKRPGDQVVECYTTFLSGLLDVTDNIVGDSVVPPSHVVRADGDDPYLVVAADKGTATFSDIANGVSEQYGFWLGDAFASGGSVGYDHKAMGITARSAWVSVQRHFRELGVDVQEQDFTVAGIGDMSGDVFGNGMMLSPHIRLVAAFDHRHIFLDPDPDPAAGLAERERLFALPRSSWDDYDRSLISEGGGIFPRAAKSIELTPQVREALAVDAERLTPSELMQAILRAPVDLLWNGGIGTYVKAASETHADVGDKANDRDPRERPRPARAGGRRGRQPRRDPARADRVRAEWRAHQHRRDRQRGRRELLRPRGQHQGAARHRRRGRGHDGQAAQHAAGRDDRRRRRARPAGLVHADAGAVARPLPGARDARRPRPLHARPGGVRPAEPDDRDVARRGRDRRAPTGRPRAHAARAGGAARLLEDHALRLAAGLRPAGRPGARGRAGDLLPAAAARALRRRDAPAPAAPRDHRDAGGEPARGPRGDDVHVPPARGHGRVARRHRPRLRDRPRRVRHAHAVVGRSRRSTAP